MTSAPKRRWFQWSLRTLFVVVTLAGWFIWQVEIVRERKDMLNQIWERGGIVYGSGPIAIAARGAPGIPFWRRWIGDEQQHVITIPREGDTDNFFHRAEQLFPEAKVHLGLAESETTLQVQAYRRRKDAIIHWQAMIAAAGVLFAVAAGLVWILSRKRHDD